MAKGYEFAGKLVIQLELTKSDIRHIEDGINLLALDTDKLQIFIQLKDDKYGKKRTP